MLQTPVPMAASFGGGVSPGIFFLVLFVVLLGLPALLFLLIRRR